jgi:Asp-tRNA(Asn)/Glu-tRNA(Gln) amidotransferase A subunit family amidase
MDGSATKVVPALDKSSGAKWLVLSVLFATACSDSGAPKPIAEPAAIETPAVVTADTPAEPDSLVSVFRPGPFHVEEATIADIQQAIVERRLTATQLVTMYLKRIQAYNGTCVNQPSGILGPISVIPHAGKLNALMTLNLRPQTRTAWGFGSREARSQTDMVDDDPNMPDALEVAASLDAQFAQTGKLVGPLHGVVLAIKDQYNTFDMRTTAGGDAFYANDRPPRDATFVKRLRDAGAILIAKSNMGEYAAGGVTGTRSSWGGTMCDDYDTERSPGSSSGGSGMATAANFVTCAIGEESGTSVREPSKNNSEVGIAPTRELVSANGMFQRGLVTRVGPICRTVEDAAKILDVYAGFDTNDEWTAFSINRKPDRPYYTFTHRARLDGVRIGVVREYMDKALFTVADDESIDIVDKAIDDLRQLGATIVDPGEHGALCQKEVDRIVPEWRDSLFIQMFPNVFPVNTAGMPTADHIATLLDMFFGLAAVPHTSTGSPSLRNLGAGGNDVGDTRYFTNLYLQDRGDSQIATLTDLYTKANFWNDPAFPNKESSLMTADQDRTLVEAASLQNRFATQTAVFQCFADNKLDAVVYPTGNIPPAILTSPREPTVNDRSSGLWTNINSRGFPAMTVPAGFTTQVYDRAEDGTLLPPVAAQLPVGIDLLGLPFSEPKLFEIGAAYEAATHHRRPPPDFGPLDSEGKAPFVQPSTPRPMPRKRSFSADELKAINQD